MILSHVEIVGKKFNYNDTIISCIGKLRHDDLNIRGKNGRMGDSDLEVEMDLHDNSDSEIEYTDMSAEPYTSDEEETDWKKILI
jgi:hypothetical protein